MDGRAVDGPGDEREERGLDEGEDGVDGHENPEGVLQSVGRTGESQVQV